MICSNVQECIKKFDCFLTQEDQRMSPGKGKRYRAKKKAESKKTIAACNNINNQNKCIMFFERRSKATCKEKGKSYTFDQSVCRKQWPIISLHIDGGIIDSNNYNKCDYAYVLLDRINGGKGRIIFIELKGGNVNHAIQQLEASISMDIFKDLNREYKKIYGRIVSSSVPKIRDGSYIELQKRLRKLGGNLKIQEINFVEKYEHLDEI